MVCQRILDFISKFDRQERLAKARARLDEPSDTWKAFKIGPFHGGHTARVQICYPPEEVNKGRSVKAKAVWTVPLTLKQMLTTFRELDITGKWMPVLGDIVIYEAEHPFDIVAHGIIYAPFMGRFETAVVREFFPSPEEKAIFISDTCLPEDLAQELPSYKKGKNNYVHVEQIAFIMEEVDESNVRVTAAYHVSSKIPRWMVPEALVSLSIRLGVSLVYRSMLQSSLVFDTLGYGPRMDAQPHFYSTKAFSWNRCG